MSWLLKGESAKTLDATSRSLASLNLSSAVLKFQSLAGDTLTWTADTTAATGEGTIIPDFGQVVELYWDTTRKFRGHVTSVKVGMRQIAVEVSGPWWWMERTNLTEVQTDATGATAERASYVFPTQSLATSIGSLIARAVTNGVPMTAGSVATMFDVPRMTLAEMSCANALATLMAWCPDAVAWFDYSGASPVLNITRRGVVSPTTYTLGTDAIEIGEITPRMDLEVARNEIHYVTRNATTGKPAWASQTSGTDAAGKRQIVTVSGPEIADFLPKDDFDTADVQTLAVSTLLAGGIRQYDTSIWSIFTTYGYGTNAYYGTSIPVPGSYFYDYSTSKMHAFPAPSCKTKAGVALAAGSYHFIISADIPSWLQDQAVEVDLSVWLMMIEAPATTGWSPGFAAFRQGATDVGQGIIQNGDTTKYFWAVREAKLSGWALTVAHTALTTLYKPWDYDYLTPPAGLAAALVTAQAWVPWEGPITLVADDVSGTNLLPAKYNLANGITACATMAALAKAITHDIFRGRTTIELGAPARLDFGTLVSRVRQDPKDNIVYL